MYACRDGHSPVVKLLLENKASYDLEDQNGWTAIQYGQSFPQVVNLLESAVIRDKGLWHLFPPALMEEFSLKFPNFYLDLCSYLAKYGDSPGETVASPSDSASPKQRSKALTMESFSSDFFDIRPMTVDTTMMLFQCIKDQNPDQLKTLLAQQHSETEAANSKESSSQGLPILLAALRYRPMKFEKLEKMCHILVASGANVKAVDPETKKSCLHFLLEVSALLCTGKNGVVF